MKNNPLTRHCKVILGLAIMLASLASARSAYATMNKYAPGDTITIGEFVYDDNGNATTSNCNISIYDDTNNAHTPIASNITMSTSTNGDGWHFYSTTTLTSIGIYPAMMACGSVATGDAASLDKSFMVGYANASTTSIASAVWNSSATTSIASAVNTNTNATVLAASSSLASSLPSLIWNFTGQVSTAVGSVVDDIASSIWNYTTGAGRALTSALLGSGSPLATQSDVTAASSSLASAILNASTSLASNINANTNAAILAASTSLASNINANTNSQIAAATSSVNAHTDLASTSLGATLATVGTNINTTNANVLSASTSLASAIASGTSAVNSNTNSTVLAASSSLASAITGETSNVNANTNATVLAASSSLASAITSPRSPWTVSTADSGTITAGSVYRATVTTVYNGTLTDSANLPTVTIYDPSRNMVVSGANMTRVATGTYSYAYTTAGNAAAGTWESVFSTTVEPGKTLPGDDFWDLVTSPAQVIINGITNNAIPAISANVTITDEGLSGNEYHYQWCVVSDASDPCGSGNNVFDATASKYINAGEDFNTTLTATVPNTGDYYFKLIVYFGTESSGASRSFTAVIPSNNGNNNGNNNGGNTGGGGGNGGGANGVNGAPGLSPVLAAGQCADKKKADFNCDGKVDSIDFSILLYYWEAKQPFANPRVDINNDGKVDSTDFSILLYEWDK